MPKITLEIPLDNIAQNHGPMPSDCDPYLFGAGENVNAYLLQLSKACKCHNDFDNCKELDYDPKDGHLTCKQTATDGCRWWSTAIFYLWEEVPKVEDEYCTEQYNICKNLDASCN